MIAILGGLGAAVSWGLSTVVASRSTRMIGSQQALAYVMLLGLGALAVLAPASGFPQHATGHAWAWAVLAGAGSAAGLSMMYRAVHLGKVGVVAPIASTEGALAAVFAIALGETLTAGVAVCLIVIACGVVIVTMRGHAADLPSSRAAIFFRLSPRLTLYLRVAWGAAAARGRAARVVSSRYSMRCSVSSWRSRAPVCEARSASP